MKKYEELENNLYVREVNNLSTVSEAAKLLGISNQELKKFIIKNQLATNKIINNMLDKLFKYSSIPTTHQDYYIELLSKVQNLEYVVSVIDYNHPNLKKNPSLLFQTIIGYKKEDIRDLDTLAKKEDDSENDYLIEYVTTFASDYGISSTKLYNFIIETRKKNNSIFSSLMKTYELSNYGKVTNENTSMSTIKKIHNLEYIVAALIYNFPATATTTDTFLNALASAEENNIEQFDNREIEDSELQKFISSKKEYQIIESKTSRI